MDKKDKNTKDADVEKYLETIKAFHSTKGYKKLWNYFLDITKKDYFVGIVKELREKYNIPPDGLDDREDYIFPPIGYSHEHFERLREDIIEKICKKYRLHYYDFSEILLGFVYYNIITEPPWPEICGLFRVADVILEKKEPFDPLIQEGDDMAHPIALRISPYASQRDIIDFLKNKFIWTEIESLQEKYKEQNIKIGRVKSKDQNIQNRNDFIYQNSHKTLKEIRKLLSAKGTYLDDGHIAKIISLEKQRRKDM